MRKLSFFIGRAPFKLLKKPYGNIPQKATSSGDAVIPNIRSGVISYSWIVALGFGHPEGDKSIPAFGGTA